MAFVCIVLAQPRVTQAGLFAMTNLDVLSSTTVKLLRLDNIRSAKPNQYPWDSGWTTFTPRQ
jgi:hypothetical protein